MIINAVADNIPIVSPKSRLIAAVICLLFGPFGAHRFYTGKFGTAITQLLTFGALGIWSFIDLIIILLGGFKDSSGRRVTNWNP